MHVIHFKSMLVAMINKFKLDGTKGHSKKPFYIFKAVAYKIVIIKIHI